MTSRPFDPSDPTAGTADAADDAAASCADLARWCDDADPDARRDGRALASADRHLADCSHCRDRFGAELRLWAALAAADAAPVSLAPTYRPPTQGHASDAGAGASNSKPMRTFRVAMISIVGAAIVVCAMVVAVRTFADRSAVDAPASRDAANDAANDAVTTASPTSTSTSTPTSPSEAVAPDGDPRFRRQIVTRALAGDSRGAPSDLRPSALLVRAANDRTAPIFSQSFSVEQRTPSSTSLLVLESAARTLAVRAP